MSFKFQGPGFPSRWSDRQGLKYRCYSLYTGSADGSPDPASLISGSLKSTSGSSTQINSFSIGPNNTFVWRGYFEPDSTGDDWQFRVTSDDGSYLWLEDPAEASVTSLNPDLAIVKNSGSHGLQSVTSANLTLTSSLYYSMTLVAGNNTGTGSVTLEWSDNGGASFESSGSTYLSHDSRYPDGFGADFYEYAATGQTATRWSVTSGNTIDHRGKFYYLSNDTIVAATGSESQNNWLGGYNIFGVQSRTDANIRALGYGKDASGNGIYIAARTDRTNNEFAIQSGSAVEVVAGDPPSHADVNPWTLVDVTGSSGDLVKIFDIVWGADSGGATAGTWMAVGDTGTNQEVYRSRDGGQNWQAVAIPSADSSKDVFTIASNGSGTWAFVHDDGFYLSTDDGASFTRSTPFTMTRGFGVGYNKSNDTWIVSYINSGTKAVRTCSGTDFTTWSSETEINGTAGDFDDVGHASAFIRAYNGRVMIQPRVTDTVHNQSKIAILDVNGTSISNLETIFISGHASNIRCSATDGITWLIGGEGGSIWKSSDNAETWVKISEILGPTSPNYAVPHTFGGGVTKISMAADVYYPL